MRKVHGGKGARGEWLPLDADAHVELWARGQVLLGVKKVLLYTQM